LWLFCVGRQKLKPEGQTRKHASKSEACFKQVLRNLRLERAKSIARLAGYFAISTSGGVVDYLAEFCPRFDFRQFQCGVLAGFDHQVAGDFVGQGVQVVDAVAFAEQVITDQLVFQQRVGRVEKVGFIGVHGSPPENG
jgi:hypothetical protein